MTLNDISDLPEHVIIKILKEVFKDTVIDIVARESQYFKFNSEETSRLKEALMSTFDQDTIDSCFEYIDEGESADGAINEFFDQYKIVNIKDYILDNSWEDARAELLGYYSKGDFNALEEAFPIVLDCGYIIEFINKEYMLIREYKY